MQGWGWKTVHRPDMLEKVIEVWTRSLREGAPFEMEFPLRRKDGVFRWFLTRVRPLRDEAGRIVRWFGTNTDIDDARRASMEREQLVADLQTALRARDEFLSNASHELRTPLTSLQLQLQGTARLVEKQELSGSAKFLGKLKVAGRQAEYLAALIDRLLDGARCSTGELTLKREQIDLVEVARNVLRRSGPQARSAGCALSLHAEGAVLGSWDQPRLEQALSNLMSNALKYGSAAPIEVSVTGSSEWARIVVRDHGVGIEHDDLTRIFGQFERAVSLRHYGGLGLGLYIARQIVEAHGGTIDAASEQGHGATFTVNLRRQLAVPEPRVQRAAG